MCLFHTTSKLKDWFFKERQQKRVLERTKSFAFPGAKEGRCQSSVVCSPTHLSGDIGDVPAAMIESLSFSTDNAIAAYLTI